MNIEIITHEDTRISLQEWQEQYSLKGTQIGRYFTYTEWRFAQDLKQFGRLYVCEPLMYVMDLTRKRWGKPLHVNSYNRTPAYQDELRARGLRAATTSPHVVKLAADLDTTNHRETKELVPVVLQAARDLKIQIRLGYAQYMRDGSTFIHIDVCPEYYTPGQPRHDQPHPAAWEIPYLTW